MNVTQRIFRFFRQDDRNPASPESEMSESGQRSTSPAEVPADQPITQSIFRSLFIPPNLLIDPPPTWVQMRNYAHHAPYAGGGNRLGREAGAWYFRFIALPLTTLLRYAEWIILRPARLITLGVFVWWGFSLITTRLG